MSYNIAHTDIMQWAKEYNGAPFHALLCDPPYELAFMGKRWDNSGISFRPETWAALARHLHPGAYGMAFASTRGYHRMACAIEDAGLIIHTMFGWSFGSGFPKATRIDVQVDRRAGAERTVVGTRKHAPKFNAKAQGYREKDNGYNSRERESFEVTAPATELAAAWEGHRYGGQAIKPAFEPIVVFQKPYQGRPVDSITRTGAGALWVDGGRVATAEDTARAPAIPHGPSQFGYSEGGMGGRGHEAGRWPANLILAHDPACNGYCVEGCAVRRLGEQSGELMSGDKNHPHARRANDGWGMGGGVSKGDSGTAARYFYNAGWMYERLDAADPVRYVAKASTGEREAGLDGWERTTVDDGRQTPIDNPYLRGETERRNTHPTVKPTDLCRYLATLLLPPPPYAPRRLLVPFAGSGSEMIGAGIAGWEYMQGVESEAEHVEIARARLQWWLDVFPA